MKDISIIGLKPQTSKYSISDPYVKIWLIRDGKKVEKQKTSTKQKTRNPIFNESFIFNISNDKVKYTSLRISVIDHDKMGRNDLIGEIMLGIKSGPQEVRQWMEMLSKKYQPIVQWHELKGSLG